MLRFITSRILVLLILWLSLLWLPWWFLLTLALLAVYFQTGFYELILIGLLYDSLYGPGGDLSAPYWPLLATLVAFLLVWIAGATKEYLVIYRHTF